MARVSAQLHLVARTADRVLEGHLAQAGGSTGQWRVLQALDGHPGASQKELAADTGLQGSTMTHHLERLEADGLVTRQRDAADRRVQRAVLTARGRRHLARLERAADAADEVLVSLLAERDAKALPRLLGRLQERLEADLAAPGGG